MSIVSYLADRLNEKKAELAAERAKVARLREALRDLVSAVDMAVGVKRGDFYHERKNARAALKDTQDG